MNRKVRYVNCILRESLALNCDDIVICRLNYCNDIKVYACRKNFAVIMVGMIAADFRASGG